MTDEDHTSPFPFYGPLAPEEVSGREELIVDLTNRLTEHRVTALLGPRRYGKTSVLRRVSADLAGVGPETVWIDLYELTSMADLASAIDQGLAATKGRVRRAFEAVADRLSLRLGVVTLDFAKGGRSSTDPALVVRSLLDVLVETAQHHPLIVVFDEFAGIANVKGGAGKLRTALQHHYRDIGIVFAGSQPSTMRLLFADRAQPFFAQADIVEIGPLDDGAVRELVEDGFARTGRDAGVVATSLVTLADGHPQRAMQLADALWRYTSPGSEADSETWAKALVDVRAKEDDGSERLFALLPVGQQRVLRAVAADGRVYGRSAAVLDLAPGTARSAVDTLIGDGQVVRRDDRLAVVDPLFADWIRRRFPLPA